MMTATQPRLHTRAQQTNKPTDQHPKKPYPPALHELITTAIPTLENLRDATLRGHPIDEAAAGEDFLKLACFFGALTSSERLWCAIAKHPQAPTAVLGVLAERESEEVRIALASNPSTPAEALTTLAGNELTRRAVAGNPSAPPGVLTELAKHWDVDVRTRVMHNPNTPETARWALRGPEIPTEVYLP